MAKRIQKEIVTNQLTLTIGIVASIVMWAVCYLVHPIATLGETIGAYALYALIGYLLIILNKSFSIIRLRASFQTVIFLVLVSIFPQIHALYEGNIMAVCYLIGTFFLFNSFQKEWSAGLLFHAFIFLGIGCLFVPKIVWLIPYMWFSCYVFRSLNLRSFVASIFGCSIPITGYTIYDFINNQGIGFAAKLAEVTRLEGIYIDNLQLPIVVMLLFSFIIFVVSATHSILYSMDEKVQTRSYLQHLIVVVSLLFVLSFSCLSITLQLMPLILIGIGLLYGHFSTLTKSKWSNIFFISMLVITIPIFIINLLY